MTRGILLKVLLPVMTVVVAAGLRIWPLSELGNGLAWLTFYPAVMIAATFAGFTGGLLTVVLTCLVIVFGWEFLAPKPFIANSADWLGAGVFVFNGLLMSTVGHMMLRAKEQLAVALAHAETANRTKSLFLATMSHEIRTPLNALIGTAYLLGHSTLSTKQRDDLRTIESAGRNLLALINDILDISKIEAGELAIDPHNFALESLLADLHSLFAPSAATKGIELVIDAGEVDLGTGLHGDSHRLRQCLTNLLSNALKFTERGRVTLSVTALPEASDAATTRLRFTITDTGIGMDATQLARLFTPFSQADTSTSRRFGGTGLGLSIVKRVTELMGGTTGVASTPGEGSTFWLELPFGLTSLPATGDRDGGAASRALRLLVVDDNPGDREIFVRLADSFGWDVQGVDNGRDMVERVLAAIRAEQAIDCVLLDWRLPEMDGIAALALLKERIGNTAMPSVIMVTAADRAELTTALREPRPDSLLIKPLEPSTLFNAVNEAVLAHGFGLDRLLTYSQINNDNSQWLSGVELLVVDDSHLNLDVIGRVLLREGARPTLCESGYQALDELKRHPRRFEAVLMDLQMPELDGCESTRLIRQQPAFAGLPVIALTAGATSTEQQRAKDAGMNDFLTKPVDPKVLVRTLRRHVEQRRGKPLPVVTLAASNEDAAPNSRATGDWPTLNGVDIQAIHRLIGDDLAFYTAQIERFLGEADELIGSARNALQRHDQADAARPIHRLRGQAGNLGHQGLMQLAGQLEEQAHAGTLTDAAISSLQALVDRLRSDYADWAARQPDAASTELAAADALDPAQLALLIAQVEDNNLNSLSTAKTLGPALREALGEVDYAAFTRALNALKFADARACLRSLG